MSAQKVQRFFLIIFLAGLTAALPLQAAELTDPKPAAASGNEGESTDDLLEGDDKKEKKPEAERFRLLPVPIFITEPAIGEGLGVALTLFHPLKEGKGHSPQLATLDSIGDIPDSREAPPVITAVAGAYTNSESWMAGIGHFNNWRNDSIRYAGALAAAKINSQIYIQNIPLSFSMEAEFLYQDLKIRVKDSNFMLGAGFSYLDADNKFGIGIPDGEGDRFATDFANVGLAAKASYETRDNMMNPRGGQIVELNLWRYDDAIGGDYDYWSASLKALSFHSLSEKVTLGLRADFSAVDGRVPFFAIPFVKLRGVPALRYQNKIAGAVEVEGRYLIRPRWEVSLFGGLGYTSDDYPIFENTDSIYNFGVGGRYNVFQAHNVWVGIDIARGPEDWNWYIQVGHPW
jgi:hypothetical protein